MKRSPKPIDARILNALSVLESKQGRELSIDETAALCHMSTSHFYAIFKKEVGCTPVEYKNRAAIDYAVQLLFENPHLSIDRLSEKAGFESASYFRRVFKATPAFRRGNIGAGLIWMTGSDVRLKKTPPYGEVR